MIRFKQSKINRIQAGRVTSLISHSESDENQKNYLVCRFDKINLKTDMGEVIKDLNSTTKEGLLKALEEAGTSSDIKENLEQLTSDRIHKIIQLSDIDTLREEYPNAQIPDLVDIQKIALKNIYRMISNCENYNFFGNFTEFDFSYLINELPNIYVPLIFSIILKYDTELPNKISSQCNEAIIEQIFPEYDENEQQMSTGILFIYDKFRKSYEYNRIDVYSIIQLISLLFKYSVVSEEEATVFINKIVELCFIGRKSFVDSNYLNFFLFDFIHKLDKPEHFQILSETNFFSESTKYFTNLSIFQPSTPMSSNRLQMTDSEILFASQFSNSVDGDFFSSQLNESKFIKYLRTSLFVNEDQDIELTKSQIQNILSERGMVWKFHSESLRLFFLDTVLKFLENGFIEKFIEFCFPELFDYFPYVYQNVDDYEIKKILLNKIVLISSYVIQFSEDCRSRLNMSDFHKMIQKLETFSEKVFVLNYLSFFIPFDFDNMILLASQFDIPSLCSEMMFGDSIKGILAALEIFSLFMRYAENAEYAGEDLIQGLGGILTDSEMIAQLEELFLEYENDENNDISFKIHNLLEFLKKLMNGE